MLHGGDVYTDGILRGRKLLDYSSNINPLGIPEGLRENIGEVLESTSRYPDMEYRELKENIRSYIKKTHKYFGGKAAEGIENDGLLLGNGAAELIDLVISCFKSICIIAPSFKEYEISAGKRGTKIFYSMLDGDMEFDYEDILLKIDSAEALIIGSPNNPNGKTVSREEFIKILDYCEEKNKTVIIDEAFVEFTGNKAASFMDLIGRYRCLFIIRALTKFFGMPGIRLGYAVSGNRDLCSRIRSMQNPWNINSFAEAAAKYSLSDDVYIKKTIEWIKEEKSFLCIELAKIDFIGRVYETEAPFILCRLKEASCHRLYTSCLERGLLIRKADNFTGLDESFVRFAVKDRESNARFIKILREAGGRL